MSSTNHATSGTSGVSHETESRSDRRQQRELAAARQSGQVAPAVDAATGQMIKQTAHNNSDNQADRLPSISSFVCLLSSVSQREGRITFVPPRSKPSNAYELLCLKVCNAYELLCLKVSSIRDVAHTTLVLYLSSKMTGVL